MAPTAGERWQAPSGAVFTVEAVAEGVATVAVTTLPDGQPATLRNTQRHAVAAMKAAAGWTPLEEDA